MKCFDTHPKATPVSCLTCTQDVMSQSVDSAQQVEGALVLEQTRTRTLDLSVAQLNSSMSAVREPDRKLREDMQHLAASFRSLLKDAVRHSDVLELLLGEEVLEFLDWPVHDQEANSIPALREQLRLLQEQVRGHHLSITELLSNQPGTHSLFSVLRAQVQVFVHKTIHTSGSSLNLVDKINQSPQIWTFTLLLQDLGLDQVSSS